MPDLQISYVGPASLVPTFVQVLLDSGFVVRALDGGEEMSDVSLFESDSVQRRWIVTDGVVELVVNWNSVRKSWHASAYAAHTEIAAHRVKLPPEDGPRHANRWR